MIVRFFALSCLLFSASAGRSQEVTANPYPERDGSPEQIASSTAQELFDISGNYVDVDNDLALRCAKAGYRKASSRGDSIYMVRNGLLIASIFRRTEKLDSAASMYEYILPIAERNGFTYELMVALNSSGITLSLMGSYDKALDQYFKTLEMRRQAGDTLSEIVTLSNIAVVHYKLKNYEKALEMFLACRELQKVSGHDDNADELLVNTAHAYAYLGRCEEALSSVDSGLRICGSQCSDNILMLADFVRGVVQMKTNNLEEAEHAFSSSYNLARKTGNSRIELDNLDYLSQINLETNDLDQATYYLKSAEQVISENRYLNLEKVKIYYGLSILYRELKNFKLASDYQLAYMIWKDSVHSEEMTNTLMRLEAEQIERENDAKIAAQNELLALSQDLLNRERLVNKLAIILACISSAFILILLHNYRRKKRLNSLLETKVEQRTRELSFHRERLLVSLTERDLLLERTKSSHLDFVKRTRGLCSIALQQVKDPVAREYLVMLNSSAVGPDPSVQKPVR